MSTFVQGEERKKTFYVKSKETGQPVSISDIKASLYEVKTNREVARFDSVTNKPTDLGNGLYQFTFTSDITKKCPVGAEIWFDVYVGSMKRIFRGKFGVATKSPLSNG